MTEEEYIRKLDKFATEKANEVEDISIDILKQLIFEGANWSMQEVKKTMLNGKT